MPVLIEGATWIARRSVLEESFEGGPSAFAAMVPEHRRSEDRDLVAVSFEDWWRSRMRLQELEDRGLDVLDGREAVDVALVHHRLGPEVWCPWLELAQVKLPGGGRVLAGRVAGSTDREVMLPPGWWHGTSATARDGIVDLPPMDRPLRFVRRDPDAAVYRDRFAGDDVRLRLSPQVTVSVETACGVRHEILADVVHRGPQADVGLMHRETLAPDEGMLFAFGVEERRAFWMKNTLVPLDMLFADADGVVVNVAEWAEPMTLTPYSSRSPCATVLEVCGGWAGEHGVGVGARIQWGPPADALDQSA